MAMDRRFVTGYLVLDSRSNSVREAGEFRLVLFLFAAARLAPLYDRLETNSEY